MLSLGTFLSLALHFNLIDLPSEVFVIVSLTLFLPVCLEQFAREKGYLLPNKPVPCVSKDSSSPETSDN